MLLRRYMRRTAWRMYRDLAGRALLVNGGLGANPAGAQCVNVPNELWRRVGAPQLYGNASNFLRQWGYGVEWFDMSSRLRLRAGDVVVWSAGSAPPDGHVDVVLDGSREPWLGLDQNFPLGSVVHPQSHIRDGVAGVLRVVHLGS